MAVLTPFFDVVAGVAILAGRSSLLDKGVFKTANTNFTVRHLLALGFIGYGGWNLWKIERAQDKLKKTLDAESFGAENCEYCNHSMIFDEYAGLVCSMECEADSQWPNLPKGWPNHAESFSAEDLSARKEAVRLLRKAYWLLDAMDVYSVADGDTSWNKKQRLDYADEVQEFKETCREAYAITSRLYGDEPDQVMLKDGSIDDSELARLIDGIRDDDFHAESFGADFAPLNQEYWCSWCGDNEKSSLPQNCINYHYHYQRDNPSCGNKMCVTCYNQHEGRCYPCEEKEQAAESFGAELQGQSYMMINEDDGGITVIDVDVDDDGGLWVVVSDGEGTEYGALNFDKNRLPIGISLSNDTKDWTRIYRISDLGKDYGHEIVRLHAESFGAE
tara:strand:+ start:12447 stop:13613 length:1167 start_codon:yes stop_codon:yes gene_type:complete